MPMPTGCKMVRQLMFVNGVEADELTLAEVGIVRFVRLYIELGCRRVEARVFPHESGCLAAK